MARTDLTENDWLPVEFANSLLQAVGGPSAVEAAARRERMNSRVKKVPRVAGGDATVVPEAGTIPQRTLDPDEVTLEAIKFADRYPISEEDLQDSAVDFLQAAKTAWVNTFARKLDNACLGVSVAGDGTDTAPFNSLYYEVTTNAASNHLATASGAAPTFEELSDALGALEVGDYYDAAKTIVIAHPAFKSTLRNLKDSDGVRVVSEPMNGNPGTFFGYDFVYSVGARTSATATPNPAGNPLLIVGNRDHLILGVRSGPESQVSREAGWATDVPELKMRARRGFVVADPTAFYVVEKTA